jgi:hypothetical protein
MENLHGLDAYCANRMELMTPIRPWKFTISADMDSPVKPQKLYPCVCGTIVLEIPAFIPLATKDSKNIGVGVKKIYTKKPKKC